MKVKKYIHLLPIYMIVLIGVLGATWERNFALFALVVWLMLVSFIIGLITPKFKSKEDSSILDDEMINNKNNEPTRNNQCNCKTRELPTR